ncbi:MAG TPA: ADP-ribosylglycohydrolase family protein [Streptosporangiaceae bacterium]|nr:ADP-ribosylglycohydrolase family protein [Streptosporangiaceae bacterium]
MSAGPSLRSRYRGCLLGGAVGDAVGATIEFLSLAEIREEFGPAGVTGYGPVYGRLGAITDDTQMTLFTADGLIRAQQQVLAGGSPDVPSLLWAAYQRWLATQGGGRSVPGSEGGWLFAQPFLHASRAPGSTCLRALESGRPGSAARPANDSKGCGGVMRVAPAGLADGDPFTLGCQAAALTHGHPSGYLAAGALALMIREIITGHDLSEAVDIAIGRLEDRPDGGEVARALNGAAASARAGPALAASVAGLGQGWVAEEALGIATYCALAGGDFRSAVLLAVNHDGDSDSTGAICGNLVGALLGAEVIGAGFLGDLEGRDVIEQTADDLYEVFVERRRIPGDRYPAG